MLKLEILCQFFVCHLMVTSIYQNFVVFRSVSCPTDSHIPYQIKALMVFVTFFIIIMCSKVTKKHAHQKHLKPRSNFVRSVNLVHLYRDLLLIANFCSSLIDFWLKVNSVVICGTLKVIFNCWIEEKQFHRSNFARFWVTYWFEEQYVFFPSKANLKAVIRVFFLVDFERTEEFEPHDK